MSGQVIPMSENNNDEKLTEKKALAQAEAQGIYFIDTFMVEGDEDKKEYDTKEEALKNANGANIIQIRRRDYEREQQESNS